MTDPYLDLAVRHGLLTPAQRERWGGHERALAGESLLQALRQEGLLDAAEMGLLRRLAGAPPPGSLLPSPPVPPETPTASLLSRPVPARPPAAGPVSPPAPAETPAPVRPSPVDAATPLAPAQTDGFPRLADPAPSVAPPPAPTPLAPPTVATEALPEPSPCARPASRVDRLRRWVERNRRLSGALALGAGIVLLFSARLLGPSRVILQTDPPGAEVTWNGRPLGGGWVWPWSGAGLIVPTRRFPLRVSAEGYEPVELSVDVSSFTCRDLGTIRLVPDHAFVSVKTIPAGAEVRIDGAVIGVRTPVSRVRVGNGLHRLRLALDGHAPLELPFRPAPGETLDLGTLPLARD